MLALPLAARGPRLPRPRVPRALLRTDACVVCQTKDQHLQRAIELYQQADKIDANMALTYCGKGLLHLSKMQGSKTKMSVSRTADQWNEQLSQAGTNFENALQCDSTCIPAILGKAAVCFNRRQYADALQHYKNVLQLNPACPPEVRLGLAHCLAQLRHTDKAILAFRRVLELAPANVEALAGLAILEMNAEPSEGLAEEEREEFLRQQVERGIKLLETAYNSAGGNQHAVVLNHLANHFILANDLDKATKLAHAAFNLTEVKKIRAESCYHIARSYHINAEYEQAHKYYEYSVGYSPEYLLPQYGLAQTNVHLNKLSEATACLEKVLCVCARARACACVRACACACACACMHACVCVRVTHHGALRQVCVCERERECVCDCYRS